MSEKQQMLFNIGKCTHATHALLWTIIGKSIKEHGSRVTFDDIA